MNGLILIADDDVKHLTLFTDVLQAAGYATLTAGNGWRAVDVARSAKPDLILMDLDMPDLDGYSAVRFLKQDPDTGPIPVVAVTALAMTGDRQRVLHSGFDGYLCKPIHLDELRAIVSHHLEAARAGGRLAGRFGRTTAPRGPSPIPSVAAALGRVLVADDEEKTRRMLRDIFEAEGYETILAADGEQAVERTIADRPDVVVLDVMMPQADGFEVCRRLRNDGRTSHVPILMVTAMQDRDAMLTGIRAGASDFLTKPIDVEQLRLRVRNAVASTQLYRRVQEDNGRLLVLQRLRDSLTDMIVHDMRSPLLVVSASLDELANDDGLGDHQRPFTAMGQQSCAELLDMVNALLDVSRMETGEMPLDRSECDMRAVAAAACESIGALARQKSQTLALHGDPALAVLDRELIRRVVVNLLGNAVKFSPEGATLDVTVSASDTTVHVSVADPGCGIPPAFHGRIFEKFGQVGSRSSQPRRSTGLGLTFCKLAVEAHGGHIGVTSQVGEGATFWFDLPRRPDVTASAQDAVSGVLAT